MGLVAQIEILNAKLSMSAFGAMHGLAVSAPAAAAQAGLGGGLLMCCAVLGRGHPWSRSQWPARLQCVTAQCAHIFQLLAVCFAGRRPQAQVLDTLRLAARVPPLAILTSPNDLRCSAQGEAPKLAAQAQDMQSVQMAAAMAQAMGVSASWRVAGLSASWRVAGLSASWRGAPDGV